MKPVGSNDNAPGRSKDGIAPDKRPEAMCRICRTRPIASAYRPFCSKRCADVDLGRWLAGRYVVAATPDDEEDEMPLAPGAAEDPDGAGP